LGSNTLQMHRAKAGEVRRVGKDGEVIGLMKMDKSKMGHNNNIL